jgi:hypothetical protein
MESASSNGLQTTLIIAGAGVAIVAAFFVSFGICKVRDVMAPRVVDKILDKRRSYGNFDKEYVHPQNLDV